MSKRSRSTGWTHAKRSGHAIEVLLANRIQSDNAFAQKLYFDIYGQSDVWAHFVQAGGIGAKQHSCVLGGTTPGKADISVRWSNGDSSGISVKKCVEGQAWLVSVDRFATGFQAVTGRPVPKEVRFALRLHFGPLTGLEMAGFLRGRHLLGPRHKSGQMLEAHQSRLSSLTIRAYDAELWQQLHNWFCQNMVDIASLCLRTGLSGDLSSWADHIVYCIQRDQADPLQGVEAINLRLVLEQILLLPPSHRFQDSTSASGTTLELPFGKLQMHAPGGVNQMQFRHCMIRLGLLTK